MHISIGRPFHHSLRSGRYRLFHRLAAGLQPSRTTRYHAISISLPRYSYSTTSPPSSSGSGGSKSEAQAKLDFEQLTLLEESASAPWLFSLHQDHKTRLEMTYTILLHIVLYLTRTSETEQFLHVFETAPVPPDSEIGRARKAACTIIKATVNQISSIPLSSPLRNKHPDVFSIYGALQVIHDTYLYDEISNLETWTRFWSKAQPVVLELSVKLDENGFGWTEEERDGLFQLAQERGDKPEKG